MSKKQTATVAPDGGMPGTMPDAANDPHAKVVAPAFDRAAAIAAIRGRISNDGEDVARYLKNQGDSALEQIRDEVMTAMADVPYELTFPSDLMKAGDVNSDELSQFDPNDPASAAKILGGVSGQLLSGLFAGILKGVQPDMTKWDVNLLVASVGGIFDSSKPAFPGVPFAITAIDAVKGVTQDFIRAQFGKAASDPVVIPPMRQAAPGTVIAPQEVAGSFCAALGVNLPAESKEMLSANIGALQGLGHLERGNAIRILSNPAFFDWFIENGPDIMNMVRKLIFGR